MNTPEKLMTATEQGIAMQTLASLAARVEAMHEALATIRTMVEGSVLPKDQRILGLAVKSLEQQETYREAFPLRIVGYVPEAWSNEHKVRLTSLEDQQYLFALLNHYQQWEEQVFEVLDICYQIVEEDKPNKRKKASLTRMLDTLTAAGAKGTDPKMQSRYEQAKEQRDTSVAAMDAAARALRQGQSPEQVAYYMEEQIKKCQRSD